MLVKKILLSAYACSPSKGSEEGRGWNWAVGLAQKGYQVICLTNVDDKEKIEIEHKKLNLPSLKFEFVELSFDLDKRLFNPSAKTIYLHYYLWKKKAANIAFNLHKKHHFDIAHHTTYGSFQQGSCLYKLDDCKIIFGPVGGGQMALPIFKPYFGSSWKTEVVRGFISKLLLKYSSSLKQTIKKATYVISTNQETKDLLESTTYSKPGQSQLTKVYAIPKMYDNLKYIEKADHKELRIIWVGRLLPRKGLNLSLHALSFLPKDFPYKLTIVGGGQNNASIDGWIEEYGLDKSKIQVLGQIPFSEVANQYRKADIMLFCSLRDTSGTQIMEAMAYSLPLITLNISGARNLIPKTCAIKITPTTTENTVRDIAKAIEKMYYDIEFRKECGINAHKHAMNSTWDRRIEVLTSSYY